MTIRVRTFVIILFILISCNTNKTKINEIIIDKTIKQHELLKTRCSIDSSYNGYNGANIVVNEDDSSIFFSTGILRKKLLEIELRNCSGWFTHKIQIQIADSLFSIRYTFRDDIVDYDFIPIDQKIVLSKYPVNYNDTISGSVEYFGSVQTEYGNILTKFHGTFSCIIKGDKNELYNTKGK